MRALVMDGFGPPSAAHIADVPIPNCGPRDLLIKVVAAGVNPVDWKEGEGFLAQFYGTHTDKWVLGYDAAGVVQEVGAKVTGFRPGDRVVAFSDRRQNGHNGTFAEYLRVLDNAATRLPEAVSFEEAASLPTAAITAYQVLFHPEKAALKAGDSVLIHGASGGVGSFAVQFATAAGLLVAGTCSARNRDFVRGLGANLVVDYAADDVILALIDWRPEGLDAVVDCVSGDSLPGVLDLLKQKGRLLSIATLNQDGDIEGDAEKAAKRGLKKIWSIMDQSQIDRDLSEILALIEQGKVKIPPIEVQPLRKGAEVLQQMKDGGVRGKLVLAIDPN